MDRAGPPKPPVIHLNRTAATARSSKMLGGLRVMTPDCTLIVRHGYWGQLVSFTASNSTGVK